MPSKIRLLPEHVINVIAAGEVIENPTSVVKELVENSLDAGATHIEVDCLAGGFQRIRIEDNGMGMGGDDALLCLERHATSKLQEAADLFVLTSMGFRGEALASIAAISRMTLTTAQEESIGTRIVCQGGKILEVQKAARERGTTIEIENLFYNVPARKKFQKTAASSQAEISRLMTKLAIGFPNISFTYRAGGTVYLSTKGSTTLSETEQMQARIKELLGDEFVKNMIPLHFQRDQVTLKGYVGLPFKGKHHRGGQLLYINHRAVVSEFVEESIERAYGHSLDSKQFPMYVLHLHLPTHLVDVNVHPQKREIRFQDELWIDMILKEAITEALGYRYQVQDRALSPASSKTPESLSPSFFSEKIQEISTLGTTFTAPEMAKQTHFSLSCSFSYLFRDYGFLPIGEEMSSFFDGASDRESELLLVHLRRLYQRLLYDTCLEKLQGTNLGFSLQKLLFPIPVPLSLQGIVKADFPTIHTVFASLGILLSQKGAQFVEVEAIASHIVEDQIPSYLEEGISMIEKYGSSLLLSIEAKEEMARILIKKCRRKEISINEANQLLEQYLQGKRSQYSPFGEPIFALLGDDEIEQVLRAYQKNPNPDGAVPS